MATRASERERRRADIAGAALALFLKRPVAHVPLREIAEAIGVDFFVVYRQFADRDQLYRSAVTPLIDRLAAQLAGPSPTIGSVREAIAANIRDLTDLLRSSAYRDLAYLRLRDGALQPWLDRTHRAAIVRPFERRLESAIRRAGDAAGLTIGIRPGVGGKVFRWLEGAIAAAGLFPGAEPLTRDELDALRQTAVARLFAATYAIELAETVAA